MGGRGRIRCTMGTSVWRFRDWRHRTAATTLVGLNFFSQMAVMDNPHIVIRWIPNCYRVVDPPQLCSGSPIVIGWIPPDKDSTTPAVATSTIGCERPAPQEYSRAWWRLIYIGMEACFSLVPPRQFVRRVVQSAPHREKKVELPTTISYTRITTFPPQVSTNTIRTP